MRGSLAIGAGLPADEETLGLELRCLAGKGDAPAILAARERWEREAGIITKESRRKVDAGVDEAMRLLVSLGHGRDVAPDALCLARKNIRALSRCFPFTREPARLPVPAIEEQSPAAVKAIEATGGCFFRFDGRWVRVGEPDRDAVQRLARRMAVDDNILCVCRTIDDLVLFCRAAAVLPQAFCRHECLLVAGFDLLARAMCCCDFSAAADGRFVLLFISEEMFERDMAHCLLTEKRWFPGQALAVGEQGADLLGKRLLPVLRRCERVVGLEISRMENELEEAYPPGCVKRVADKVKVGQRLRILFLATSYSTYTQHSLRDLAEGFRNLGHEVVFEKEREGAGVGVRQDVVLKTLVDSRPDLAFCVDHFRFEFPWFPKHIPFLTWVQDLLPGVWRINEEGNLAENDFIFSFSKKWIDSGLLNPEKLISSEAVLLPVTASPKVFKPLPGLKKKYDVSFVSHLPPPSATLYGLLEAEDIGDEEKNSIRSFIDWFERTDWNEIRALQACDKDDFDMWLRSTATSVGVPEGKQYWWMDWYDHNGMETPLFHHVMMILKLRPVRALLTADLDVAVFGRNWHEYPETAGAAKGVTGNGSELNRIYNLSRINLNASPGTTYHMKAPEVIASGNFMLTMRVPLPHDNLPITHFFEEDSEIVLCSNEDELVEKAKYYLGHPEKGEAIARAAMQKFLRALSPPAVARRVLNSVAEWYHGG